LHFWRTVVKKASKQPARKQPERASKPAIVLYGHDDAGRPRAAYFEARDLELARKAADTLRLTTVEIANLDQAEVAAALPAGRIFASGRGLVPFVRKELFARWTALLPSGVPADANSPEVLVGASASKTTGSTSMPSLPTSWSDIGTGHLVVAQDSQPENGWAEANVLRASNDLLTLRWTMPPNKRFVTRNRASVALLCPFGSTSTAHHCLATSPLPVPTPAQPIDGKNNAKKSASSNEENRDSVFPESWLEISDGALVLAKDDSPNEDWWEAVVVEQNGDQFTLRWRDYGHLPVLVRHRLNLALLCPMSR
jgi:hypothetical protein